MIAKFFIKTIILSFLLLLPSATFAAKTVKGTVPNVQSLQPIPIGTSPNISNNIQFQDPSHQGQYDSSGNLIDRSGDQAKPGSENVNASQPEVVFGQQPAAGKSHSSSWRGFFASLFLLLALAAGGFWLFNRKKP